MEEILKILRNALPEAIGGLIAAGIIALLSYLFVKRLRKATPQEKAPQELLPEPPVPEIYSNLPSRTEFIGRKKEMERVKEALNSRYFLICIDGIGGIGKTSLALEVIHECLRFSKDEITTEEENQCESAIPKFDGFIWTSAKDRELRLNDILDAIARTLDWPGIAQQPYQEKIESVRKLLQTKRYLLIVDNFETITDEAVRDFLLKIPEPSKVLITSREQKLPQAWAVSIKGLEQDEALALIRNEGQRLGLKSVEDADDPVLLRLYQATGGAPLAIKWSVGQIKQKGQSLDTVLAALHEAKGDIFEQVFARSWSLLSEDAQKVLMVMPIFASSASRDAIEAASDVHHFALDDALGQLVQMWMVEVTDELETAKRRYIVHPLTRAFAEAKLRKNNKAEESVYERIINYYIEFAKQFGGFHPDTYDILEPEKQNILKMIDYCHIKYQFHKVIELIKRLDHFLGFRGYWQKRIEYGKIAIEAAKRINDSDLAASFLIRTIGWVHLKRNDYDKAKTCIKQAMNESKNLKVVGIAKRFLGGIAIEQGQLEDAHFLGEQALKIAQQINDPILENAVYRDFGLLEMQNGNYPEAEAWLRKVIAGCENSCFFYLLLNRFPNLGDTLLMQNKFDIAKEIYEKGLKISKEYKRQDTIARSKFGLAKINEKKGNSKEALNQVKEAHNLFEKLGMKKYIDESQEMIDRLEKKIRK